MNKSYRCVVIGCGWIGARVSADPLVHDIQSHAEAYDFFDQTELVALCDLNEHSLNWACERWPLARGYNNIEKMLLNELPEIVSICTPDDTHYAVCQQVMNADSVKVIIIEKPMAVNLREAQELVREAEIKNIIIIVNYSRRFADSHVAIKKQLDAGVIGEIVAITGLYSKGITHNGSHWFDLVRWLVGEIAEVEAYDGPITCAIDPTCHVRVLFKNGVQGFLVGINAENFCIFELDLIGTLGRISIKDSGYKIELSFVQKSPHYSGYMTLGSSSALEAGFKDVVLRLVEHAVGVLQKETSLCCSGSDGLAALITSKAACQSLIEKSVISIYNL